MLSFVNMVRYLVTWIVLVYVVSIMCCVKRLNGYFDVSICWSRWQFLLGAALGAAMLVLTLPLVRSAIRL